MPKQNSNAKREALFLEDATRLMRQLMQHRGMANTLTACSDLLPALIGFVQQVRRTRIDESG